MDTEKKLSIEYVLEYYRVELVPALAAALAIDDKFPEEVLNEIRAAFTHVAAASAHSSDEARQKKELDAAHRHVRRSCVDCYKVIIQVLAQKSEKAIEALTYDVNLPTQVYQQMSSLRNERMRLSAGEGDRSLYDAVEDYKALADRYDEFYQSLDTQFAGETADIRQRARTRREWRGYIIGFVLGILGGIVASVIYANMTSDPAPPSAASSPSSSG